MSAENLKGCCPFVQNATHVSEGVVDHSTKTLGGGSQDPIPLKSVSAGKSHLKEGTPGIIPESPRSGKQLKTYQDIANFFGVSRMTLFRWLKLKPFPKKWVTPYYSFDNLHLRVNSTRVITWLRALISKYPSNKARYLWKRTIRNVT